MSAEESGKPAVRLAPEERREQILAAATEVFGERGYIGATTDAIAQAAGISQAYVVRLFGSKEALFVECGARAVERVIAEFRSITATFTPDLDDLERRRLVGSAYSNLVADRGTLLTLMHFTTLGHDPTFGPLARAGYMRIYRIIRDDVGLPPKVATEFLARGMLINVLMALRLPECVDDDPDSIELLGTTFDGKYDEVIALSHLSDRLRAAHPGARASQ